VTGIEFAPGQPHYASNAGLTVVTVSGVGLGVLGLDWIDVGTPGSAAAMDEDLSFVSSTSVKVLLPPSARTRTPKTLQIAAETLASPNLGHLTSHEEPSKTVGVVYAPQPTVTSLSTPDHLLVGPDSGGTRLTIRGWGFEDGPYVVFARGFMFYTDLRVRPLPASPNTELSVTTTPEPPGTYLILVCNASNCDNPAPDGTTFTFYPPGKPKVTSVSPRSGRAGAKVTIRGDNLGYVEAVYFGPFKATRFGNGINPRNFAQENNVVLAIAPRGAVGKTVEVTVVTAESEAQRNPRSAKNRKATFTYSK
jgi:hypothetical protein